MIFGIISARFNLVAGSQPKAYLPRGIIRSVSACEKMVEKDNFFPGNAAFALA